MKEVIAPSNSSLASRASDLQVREGPTSPALAPPLLWNGDFQNVLWSLSAALCQLSQEGKFWAVSCDFPRFGSHSSGSVTCGWSSCWFHCWCNFIPSFCFPLSFSVSFLMTVTAHGTSGYMILSPFSFLEVNVSEFNLVMASNVQFLY